MRTRKTGEVSTCPSLVSDKSFVLPAYPADKIPIEVIPNLTECRGIETPKVGIPASQNRIENQRNVQQSLIALQLDMPAADASVDLFARPTTYRRKETRVNLTFSVSSPSRTESVAEKVKADSRIISRTIAILTINDTLFVGMDFQPTLPESF